MVDITQVFFLATAVFMLFSIVMTLIVPKTMQAAYWLIAMLVGVAVMFLLANSEIIFAIQLIVYSGGIAILLLFAALLTQHDEYVYSSSIVGFVKTTWSQLLVFLLIGINLAVLSIAALTNNDYINDESFISTDLGDMTREVETAFQQTTDFTTTLWGYYAPVIPFLALLLLTALLGSVKLVIREWEIEDLSEAMRSRYEFSSQEATQ